MTLEKARELLSVQADMGGGYNRNAARLIWLKCSASTVRKRLTDSFANSTWKPCSDSAPGCSSGPLENNADGYTPQTGEI